MKKIIGILVMLLMVFSTVALAEIAPSVTGVEIGDNETDQEDLDVPDVDEGEIEEPEVDEEDIEERQVDEEIEVEPVLISEEIEEPEEDEEVEEMSTGLGKQIRLLQLEKSIRHNILKGQEVIATIEGDTSELEAIIAEMETLLAEVQAADPEAEDAVEQFVDLKKEAISLSKEFRELAQTLITEEDVVELRQRWKDAQREQLKTLMDNIKNRVRAYNAKQLQKTYTTLGISDEDVIEQIKNGEATVQEVKAQIKETIQGMTKEERLEAVEDLKEEGVKRQVFRKSALEKAKLNALEREEARLTKRLFKASDIENDEKREQIRSRIAKRIQTVNKAEDITEKRLIQSTRAEAKIKNARGDEE